MTVTRRCSGLGGALAVGLLAVLAGCMPTVRQPLAPLTLEQSAQRVNANIDALPGTLKATGTVSGHVTTETGQQRHFTLDAFLIFHPPHHLRLAFKSLADTELLLGSNDKSYWYHARLADDTYYHRPHGPGASLADTGLPINPLQLIDALGLTRVPGFDPGGLVLPPVQRVTPDHQQLLFIVADARGRPIIEKEYWLSRYEPRLVERVLFRDLDGLVLMEARLAGYHRLADTVALVPLRIEVAWPEAGTALSFRIARWQVLADIGPDDPPFIPPHRLPKPMHFNHEDIVEP